MCRSLLWHIRVYLGVLVLPADLSIWINLLTSLAPSHSGSTLQFLLFDFLTHNSKTCELDKACYLLSDWPSLCILALSLVTVAGIIWMYCTWCCTGAWIYFWHIKVLIISTGLKILKCSLSESYWNDTVLDVECRNHLFQAIYAELYRGSRHHPLMYPSSF